MENMEKKVSGSIVISGGAVVEVKTSFVMNQTDIDKLVSIETGILHLAGILKGYVKAKAFMVLLCEKHGTDNVKKALSKVQDREFAAVLVALIPKDKSGKAPETTEEKLAKRVAGIKKFLKDENLTWDDFVAAYNA